MMKETSKKLKFVLGLRDFMFSAEAITKVYILFTGYAVLNFN